MAFMEDRSISRRGAIATLASLTGACFSADGGAARAQEVDKQRTPYAAPEWQTSADYQYLRTMPTCKATRYSQGVPKTCASKIFVDSDGSIHLKTLPFLERSGWMNRWRTATKSVVPQVKNPTYTDPDVHPSHGSGVLLAAGNHEKPHEIYLSNEHTFRAARWQVEDKAIYDWHYDLGVMSAKHLTPNPTDRAHPPRGRLADESITNANLCSRSVEIVGFGSDLFKFVGTPFKLPFYINETFPTLERSSRQHLLFGLKIPRGFLRQISEIGGMSGSPIVLEGTCDVVGVLCRVAQCLEGAEPIPYLVFTGPNEVRTIVARAEAPLAP